MFTKEKREWSGREDLNLRPSAPKADALPGCATPRLVDILFNTELKSLQELWIWYSALGSVVASM